MRRSSPPILAQAPALLLAAHLWLSLRLIRSALSPLVATLTAFLLCAALVLVLQSRWTKRDVFLSLFLISLGIPISFWCAQRLLTPEDLLQQVSGLHRVTGVTQRYNDLQLRLEDSSGRRWLWTTRQSLREGDVMELKGSVVPLKPSSQGFSPRLFWKARGVEGVLTVQSWRFVKTSPSLWQLRAFLRDRLALLPARLQGHSVAVLLGDRQADTAEEHRRWGTRHLLAVSGWHVGILLAVSLFFWGGGPRGMVMASLLLWAYVFFSGASVSALRAAVMLQVAMTGLMVGRPAQGINAVGIAAWLLLLHCPEVFADMGWILSVTSALLIVALHRSVLPAWSKVLLVTPVLWIITSPLVSPLAGGLFYSSLPINMMMLLFTAILMLALISALPTILALPGAKFFAETGEALLALWAALADWWVDMFPRALPATFISPTVAILIWTLFLWAGLRISWPRACAGSILVAGSLLWINYGPMLAL